MNNKYSKFLTVILVLIIIAIVSIIGFLGFKYYQTYVVKNSSEDFVNNFGDQTQGNSGSSIIGDAGNLVPSDKKDENNKDNKDDSENNNMFEGVNGNNNSGGNSSSSSSSDNRPKYNGFYTSGTIEIPATGLKSPILAQSEYSPKALETAVVELYGPGLNQVGITTISGHNYRNGTFFSNNKKLNIGDKIFIKDLSGKRLTYTIYEKFEAEQNYSDYMVKDTQGAIEIALSTCTDDSKARIIILARADV